METTTNYGFRKYQSGDLFNPLTMNNPNLDDIDTDMKAVSDRAIGRATELVSQGVHALTVLDTDCKTIKWTATANFTAGETFTINGIQCNAYLPSGEALGTNAYISGAQVLGSLNDDNSAITIYVPQGAVAVASDSERLGGELPSYYATKSYADGIKTTADNASELIGKKALVNTYYDSSVNKLYQVNADGPVGGEISMGGQKNFYFIQKTATNKIDISNLLDTDTITVAVRYSTGVASETFSVSSAKTFSSHSILAQTDIGVSVTYNNGLLEFNMIGTTYAVDVTINFNI